MSECFLFEFSEKDIKKLNKLPKKQMRDIQDQYDNIVNKIKDTNYSKENMCLSDEILEGGAILPPYTIKKSHFIIGLEILFFMYCIVRLIMDQEAIDDFMMFLYGTCPGTEDNFVDQFAGWAATRGLGNAFGDSFDINLIPGFWCSRHVRFLNICREIFALSGYAIFRGLPSLMVSGGIPTALIGLRNRYRKNSLEGKVGTKLVELGVTAHYIELLQKVAKENMLWKPFLDLMNTFMDSPIGGGIMVGIAGEALYDALVYSTIIIDPDKEAEERLIAIKEAEKKEKIKSKKRERKKKQKQRKREETEDLRRFSSANEDEPPLEPEPEPEPVLDDEDDDDELQRFSSALGESRGGGKEDIPVLLSKYRPPVKTEYEIQHPDQYDKLYPTKLTRVKKISDVNPTPQNILKTEYEMQHPDQYDKLYPTKLTRVKKISDVNPIPQNIFKTEYEMQHPDQYDKLHPQSMKKVSNVVSVEVPEEYEDLNSVINIKGGKGKRKKSRSRGRRVNKRSLTKRLNKRSIRRSRNKSRSRSKSRSKRRSRRR